MKTYQEYCDKYWELRKECYKDLEEVLNKRGVEYINVHAYTMDYAIDEDVEVPTADKNGYGVICKIDAIRKENGEWVADLIDENENPFDEAVLSEPYYFDTGILIDVYGMVLSIFEYADDNCGGKVCGKGEDLDDIEEKEEE